MIANGNSFGNGNNLGTNSNSIGTERPGVGTIWMFPGGSSGIQQLCNRM